MEKVIVIGVSGQDRSGKSALINRIATSLGAKFEVIMESDYSTGKANQLSMFDHELLITYLSKLTEGRLVTMDNGKIDNPIDGLRDLYKIIFIEGSTMFNFAKLRDLMTLMFYVDTDADTRLGREILSKIDKGNMDASSVIKEHVDAVDPSHRALIQASKYKSNIIIPNGGHNEVAISVIVETIKKLIN